MVAKTDRRLEAIQRAQVGSLVGADKAKEPPEKIPKKLSPTLATRPKKYALEMWVEIETSLGMYSTPEDDSYSIDFIIDTINHAYPSCIGMYLDVAGHMLAFYGKKTNPRAGLLHNQGVIASKVQNAKSAFPLLMVLGNVVRGLRVKIFVRVLRSSRVNLHNVNNTNVFCCV